jgi:hypothetical protein
VTKTKLIKELAETMDRDGGSYSLPEIIEGTRTFLALRVKNNPTEFSPNEIQSILEKSVSKYVVKLCRKGLPV